MTVVCEDNHAESLAGSVEESLLLVIHVVLNRIKLINISDFKVLRTKKMTARTTIVKKLAFLGAAIR